MIDLLSMMLAQSGDTPAMIEKLKYLRPEAVLFIGTVIVMVIGLSPSRAIRRSCALVAGIALAIAGAVAALATPEMPGALIPGAMHFGKPLIAVVGILLVMLLTGTVDREYEAAIDRGARFDGIRSTRGEFYAFFLFSMTGLMLCTTADDLIWLFLSLELTSLPTYVMVSISTPRSRSQEAGVKYFFLGAFGAAMLLYGFALLYGAAGTTLIFGADGVRSIASVFTLEGVGPIGMAGLIMAIVGVSFKIAAVPMHFYTPDVYEGAATSVSAMLAFVPKTAGFFALILLVSMVGWFDGNGVYVGLPEPIRVTLWVMAALTMTVGNVLAILQSNVKRMLAYSSVAHSGYMLVGVIAGPGAGSSPTSNGLAATLFYLLCYGFMNLGAFAVLACLERPMRGRGREIETVDDLRGLWSTRPVLGAVMVLCAGSLLGLPPLIGFFGKLFLFTSAIASGEIVLVIVMGLNSAIAAFYYLRLIFAPLVAAPDDMSRELELTPSPARLGAAVLSAVSVVALLIPASALMDATDRATRGAIGSSISETPSDSSESEVARVEAMHVDSPAVTD